jgi:putative ABC transport system permease protein
MASSLTPGNGSLSFGTALKIGWRDLRATPAKFLFVVLAVAVGVAALSGVKGFGYAFKGMLLRNAKQLIAADLQAQTWETLSPEQIAHLQQMGSEIGVLTRVTETVSMAASEHQHTPQMISVKGVDPGVYPFYGKIGLTPDKPLRQLLAEPDLVVVTPELAMRMKVQSGDTIRLGGKDFKVSGIVTSEPDRLASGFGPGMRLLVNRDGLERSGLVQFGSRAAQRFLFKLRPDADLDSAKERLKQIIHRVFLSDYREGSPAVGKALDNTTTFLSLVSLIALIVGSLGVAMAMHSHLQQHMDTIAVMKALGARSVQIMKIYLLQTLWLGLSGGLIGVAVGAAVQKMFPWLIYRIFALLPQVPWDWTFSFQGLALGVLATLLFTLPPLLAIRNVRPALVFRRNMNDAVVERRQEWRERLPGWSGISIIVLGLYGIAAWLSESWIMGVYFLAGLVVSFLLLSAVGWLLLLGMRRLVKANKNRLPVVFRHGFANLYRPGSQARSILVALGIGVMFTLTTYLLQRTVLGAVTREGPGRQGNVFLLDIRDSTAVSRLIEGQPGVNSNLQLVGYIVARVLSRNGVPTDKLDIERKRRDDLQATRITTANDLPEGFSIREGRWWEGRPQTPELAVSEQAQQDFKLKLGDRLQFQLAGRVVTAPLVAIFRRDQRAPVRYDLVFPQSALSGLPVVFYGAVHVEPSHIPALEERLFEAFPTVTVMNLADVLTRIQEAIDQVALVVRFLALFTIVAGIIILASSVAGSRYRRIREVAILKTLGATRRRVMSIFSIEFSIVGAIGGLIGALLSNIFTGLIAERFIHTNFNFDWASLLVAVIGTAALANVAGWLASLRVLDQRPLEVLRGE